MKYGGGTRAILTLALSCRPRRDSRLGREAIWPCKTSLGRTLGPLRRLPSMSSLRFDLNMSWRYEAHSLPASSRVATNVRAGNDGTVLRAPLAKRMDYTDATQAGAH